MLHFRDDPLVQIVAYSQNALDSNKAIQDGVEQATIVELMGQLQSALTGAFPIFSDIAALVVMVLGWPYLWATSFVCGVAGCGLF